MTDAPSTNLEAGFGRNLTFSLVDVLGRAIITGEFEDRPFGTEAELAMQYGVSRSVTREAVKMLTAKGLLGARPRQGTTVLPRGRWSLFDPDILRWLLERKFSVELLRQFSEFRAAIEPEAAALAAMNADEPSRRAIAAGLERMRAGELGQDDVLDADIAFHVAILRASANPFFSQFQDVVSTALRTSIRYTLGRKGHAANVADHAAVKDAIFAGDAAAARLAMRKIVGDVIGEISTERKRAG